MTSGKNVAENVSLSILTTTQNERLRDLVQRRDVASGYSNRWMWFPGTKRPRHRGQRDNTLSPARSILALSAVHKDCTNEWVLSYQSIDLDDDIYQYGADLEDRAESGGDLGKIGARLEVQFKRFLILMALNERSKVVTPSIYMRAKCFWEDFVIPCLAATREDVTTDTRDENESAIMDALEKQGEPTSLAVLFASRMKHRGLNRDELQIMLETMERRGDLIEVKAARTRKWNIA